MKQIETEIVINASPEKVWSILTNFEDFPAWNPFIKSIVGEKVTGGLLTVVIQPPNGLAMTFKPKIIQLNANREFRWKGKLVIPGLFDGEHYFKLIDEGNDRTRFIHGEIFTGLLVGIMGRTLEKTKDGFELMNFSLKKEAERNF